MKKQFALFTVLILLLVSTGVGAQTIVLDGVPIGLTNPKEGHFTNLEASTQITLGSETITNFSGLDDDKVKVSDSDSPGNLEDQIVGGTGVTVNSDGNQITISSPPVNVEDSADGVEVTYAGEGDYDTGTAVVPALDLNGTGLVVNQTDPTVTVGGITSTVLASSSSPQQVIVRVPQGLNAGNYKLKVKNANGFSEGLIPLQQTFFDGSTWTEATPNAAWPARNYVGSVVYDNKMWVMGGIKTGVIRTNDVWSSIDGITWTQATANAAWSARYGHSLVVFDDKMWVIGGHDGATKNDVWYSTDGINWTQATSSAAWPATHNHSSVVYDNKMWVMGGEGPGGVYRRNVWYSSDGVNWTQATSTAGWSVRHLHTSLIYENKMWVIGGSVGPTYHNDVWHSTDGVNWTQAPGSASWSGRSGHSSVVYDNKMWVMGGHDGSSNNDVWYSSDGVNWTEATASAPWPTRPYHGSVVYQNKMWIMGGAGRSNDVWHTSN